MVAWDQIFAEAAAQGQTVFASTGDTGGFCPVASTNGAPGGVPDVNYPASSPYVVGAGGLTLLTDSDGSYNNEAAWLAGGGGPSLFESQPYWQSGVAPPTGTTCVEVVACLGKTLPDVAMDADPNSGANVYVGGTPEDGRRDKPVVAAHARRMGRISSRRTAKRARLRGAPAVPGERDGRFPRRDTRRHRPRIRQRPATTWPPAWARSTSPR